jgi:proteasome activator subunit 4
LKTLDTNKLFKASCELIWLVSGFTNAINIDILFLYAFSFINAKSDISPEDVHALVELGLEIFHASQNKFVVQIKWGGLLVRFLKKHAKRISLGVQWRPLYDTLIRTHFKRNMGPEGWKVRQQHFETVTSLVRASRSLFPEGAAAEIWSEFSPLLKNPWHNSAFEGIGFLRLFLPANSRNQDHFTTDWIAECLDIWGSVTNCNFWDIQWAAIVARCIKGSISVDWEKFIPLLFTRYLNMFEVCCHLNSFYGTSQL